MVLIRLCTVVINSHQR